jgi:hypothetical protein
VIGFEDLQRQRLSLNYVACGVSAVEKEKIAMDANVMG